MNPDFSQVESDAFQVEVNQRFPVFFSEKRPFFMEGAGIFNLAGNGQGDASMLYAVHTRRIVDPIVGAKLTGSLGRVAFGTLTAVDEAPGRTEDPLDPLSGKEKLFQVARAQVALKPGSYAGAMATFTSLAGRTNVVGGTDLSLKFKGSNQVTAFVLGSSTDDPDRRRFVRHRHSGQLRVHTKRVSLSAQVEHYDDRFRDGHRVSQPDRHHQRVGVRGLQLLPGQGQALLDPPHHAVHVLPGGPRSRAGGR